MINKLIDLHLQNFIIGGVNLHLPINERRLFMRIIKKRGILSLALALALVFSFVPSFSAKAEGDIAYLTTGDIAVLADGTISDDGTYTYDNLGNTECVCIVPNDVTSYTVNSASKTIKFTNASSSINILYYNTGWTLVFDGTNDISISVEGGDVTIDLTPGSTLTCGYISAEYGGASAITIADNITMDPEDANLAYETNVTFTSDLEPTEEEETTEEETTEEETTEETTEATTEEVTTEATTEATTDAATDETETTVAYTIVEGADQNITDEEGKDLVIRASGDLSKFTDLKIDGTVVDKVNYETAHGSTIATIKSSFLATLAAGAHTVTFVYTDGETSTTFTLTKAAEVTTPSNNETTTEATTTAQSPKTGDSMMIFVLLLSMSVLGLGVLTKTGLKKRFK